MIAKLQLRFRLNTAAKREKIPHGEITKRLLCWVDKEVVFAGTLCNWAIRRLAWVRGFNLIYLSVLKVRLTEQFSWRSKLRTSICFSKEEQPAAIQICSINAKLKNFCSMEDWCSAHTVQNKGPYVKVSQACVGCCVWKHTSFVCIPRTHADVYRPNSLKLSSAVQKYTCEWFSQTYIL